MGLLDKHKKTKGAWGQKIVRSPNTYGKNLNRVIDQNELIKDIETNYGTAADVATNTTNIATNAASIVTDGWLMNATKVSSKSVAEINTGFQAIAAPGSGKAIVLLGGYVSAIGGSGTESANKTLQVGYTSSNLGIALTAEKFMQGIANLNRITTSMKVGSAGASAFYNPGDTTTIDNKPVYVKSDASFNGNWTMDSIIIFYAIVGCTDAGQFSPLS